MRDPDHCEYREAIGSDPDFRCNCKLLREIFHEFQDAECVVKRDTCQACCASFPPNRIHPNPPVASSVFRIASELAKKMNGNSEQQEAAKAIRQFAVAHLPFEEDFRFYDEAMSAAAESPLDFGLESIIPVPKRRSGPRVRDWAVGITTARRREPTLNRCINSLTKAGWSDFHIFEDGSANEHIMLAEDCVTKRQPPVGAWPNYYLSMIELLMRKPNVDAILMLQDDVVFPNHGGVRQYLERVLWPGSGAGVVSLFCPAKYTHSTNGWSLKEGAWFWGAQALVFERRIAARFLSNDFVMRHRCSHRTRGLANIDWLVGEWAAREGVPIAFPTPSLVQHIGRTSAIWTASNLEGDRLASRYLGAELTAKLKKDGASNIEKERAP